MRLGGSRLREGNYRRNDCVACSVLSEATLSEGGSSLFDGSSNAAGAFVANVFDTLGWVLPALFLSALLLAALAARCWLVDDIPLEAFQGIPGIFRWAKESFSPGDGPKDQLLSIVPKSD